MDNPSLIDYLTYKAMMWHFLGVMSNVFNIKKVYIIIDTSETHDPWKKKNKSISYKFCPNQNHTNQTSNDTKKQRH